MGIEVEGSLGGGEASELQVDSGRKRSKSQCVKFVTENDIGCAAVSHVYLRSAD